MSIDVKQQKMAAVEPGFVFDEESFPNPDLPHGLDVVEVPLRLATPESLKGFGILISQPDELTVEKKNFEIVKWPVGGWRELDPNTGDEAGTTEGDFEVHWQGDYYMGKNLAINTTNNVYLDGLGCKPEHASRTDTDACGSDDSIYLWMSDYHPDGGQLFYPRGDPVPFTVCLGPASCGDDVKPTDMVSFHVPAGKGVYIHPGTWHNGVYMRKKYCPATMLTRQGRVHGRVSASWAAEFKCLLKVSLLPTAE
eukprot:scpid103197/ scgid18749/ 